MMRSFVALAIAALLAGCATASAPLPEFQETYVGKSGIARMTLETLRPLPKTPESGWLNLMDQAAADARFAARRNDRIKFKLDPAYVAFQAEQVDPHPMGKFQWRDGVLTICMLTLDRGVDTKTQQFAIRLDYDTCAPMQRTDQR